MSSVGGRTSRSQVQQEKSYWSPKPKSQPEDSSVGEKSPKHDAPVTKGEKQPILMESMAKLLQAQTQMLAA